MLSYKLLPANLEELSLSLSVLLCYHIMLLNDFAIMLIIILLCTYDSISRNLTYKSELSSLVIIEHDFLSVEIERKQASTVRWR